jgi:predicted metal-dependent hydrolase
MVKDDIFTYILFPIVILGAIYIYFEVNDDFDLKCIVSGIDGNKYCVRERKKINEAADLLASVTQKCQDLTKYLEEKYPDKDEVKRLCKGFKKTVIKETLPTSTYTAYSENKGEKIAFCLNKKKEDNNNLIDESTLTFVAIHEMAHIMTKSIGHKQEFWDNFKFLLENAKEAGIHDPVDYSKQKKEYCGMKITDNPYYDH